jgi:hypothetical protein
VFSVAKIALLLQRRRTLLLAVSVVAALVGAKFGHPGFGKTGHPGLGLRDGPL